MLSNLIFCLNAIVPIFAMMILGMVFMKAKIFNEDFVKMMNSFVFKIALPVLVFHDLCKEDFYEVWDTRFVLFCFFGTLASIGLVSLISKVIKDRGEQGEFIQVAYRSSAAILGVALVQNLYGSSGMTPLMIIGSVPLYNIFAVIVLSLFSEDRKPLDKALMLKTIKNVAKNPIIWGVFIGLAWSVLRVPMPQMLDTTVNYVARIATPLGLMAMGATFDIKKARSSIGFAGLGAFMKLIGLGLIFIPIAIAMGFTGTRLAAILIMCCSPTTVSCFIMAKNLGHDGTLTSSTVMLTTFFSAFTLTIWLFVLKTMAFL